MEFSGGSLKFFFSDWVEGNVGNVEFDGDGTVMSNSGSNGVGCEHVGGCSAVEFFFSSFDGALAFFMSLP